jgi:hypothetical protein
VSYKGSNECGHNESSYDPDEMTWHNLPFCGWKRSLIRTSLRFSDRLGAPVRKYDPAVKSNNLAVFPTKESRLAKYRVNYKGHLPGRTEKVGLNEHVVFREKNSKQWVGVIPPDHSMLGKVVSEYLVDFIPSLMGESQRCWSTGSHMCRNCRDDRHVASCLVNAPNQHSTLFDARV